MMNLRKIGIGYRLGLVFSIQILLLLGIAFQANASFASLSERMREITTVNNAEAELAVAMRAAVSYRMIALRDMVLVRDADEVRRAAESIGHLTEQYSSASSKLRIFLGRRAIKADERTVLEEEAAAVRAAGPLMDRVIQLRLAGHTDEASGVLVDRLRPVQARWSAALTRLGEIKARQNAMLLNQALALQKRQRILMLGIPALAVVVAALLAWRLTRSITKPLADAVALARTVARGDLFTCGDATGHDEPAQLMRALNEMTASLRSAIGTVNDGSQAIRTASAALAASNVDLSGRTESQASALEETASAMEELTSTVRQSAENAAQASTLARSAAELAADGGEQVRNMVSTMDGIDDAAHRITTITGVIDEIAFQTNLLALNAAVEAARAGAQGRGFAVVAGEVRNLAQRSAGAAREIKQLIDSAVVRVEDGSRLARSLGAAMDQVVDSARRVSSIIGDISRASQEQSDGIGQVNDAIASMDTMTQQNAALVEEAAATAETLHRKADQLAGVVAEFRLDRHPVRGTSPEPAAAAHASQGFTDRSRLT